MQQHHRNTLSLFADHSCKDGCRLRPKLVSRTLKSPLGGWRRVKTELIGEPRAGGFEMWKPCFQRQIIRLLRAILRLKAIDIPPENWLSQQALKCHILDISEFPYLHQ